MTVMVFDIETVPDFISGKKLNELDESLSDEEVSKFMLNKRKEESGTEFLPHYLHKIVAISVVVRTPDWFKVWSLGDLNDKEPEIIKRFFKGLNKYTPTLVSWNGTGFDLPVLHYRALLHGVSCKKYWEIGESNKSYKWNNYTNRFHYRHIDVMDVLSGYQARSFAPLDVISQMLGFPGKMGIKGDQVCGKFLDGKINEIRDYCETDVLNTYLVFLRFQQIRGKLTNKKYKEECDLVKEFLKESNKEHFKKFLLDWETSDYIVNKEAKDQQNNDLNNEVNNDVNEDVNNDVNEE